VAVKIQYADLKTFDYLRVAVRMGRLVLAPTRIREGVFDCLVRGVVYKVVHLLPVV